jgi:hypothetical protein
MKYKNFIIPLVVFPFDVMVSIGQDSDSLFKELIKRGVPENDVQMAEYENIGTARYCLFSTGQSLIRIKKKPQTPKEYGHLHHEIFHTVASIMWRIGMKLEITVSDETYAYLIQYLTEQIYSKLWA